MLCGCGSRRHTLRAVGGVPTKIERRYMIDDY
nr:MAG TPA: protein of unknown function (DUF4470) [Bacteriophage sp.]